MQSSEITLKYQDKLLNENSWLLCDYGIKDGASLHIPKATRGSGKITIFADLSNPGTMKQVQFNPNAPNYRIAPRGLSIEGYCRSSKCTAYNKLVIDKGHAMGNFDLMLDEHKCKCPKCNEGIALETCGFWGCEWRYSGIQHPAQGGAPKKVNHLEWIKASDSAYDRFEEASKGKGAAWSRLLIQTRPVPPAETPDKECPICLGAFTKSGLYQVKCCCCQKAFHGACLVGWLKGNNSCPMCRGNMGPGALAEAQSKVLPVADALAKMAAA